MDDILESLADVRKALTALHDDLPYTRLTDQDEHQALARRTLAIMADLTAAVERMARESADRLRSPARANSGARDPRINPVVRDRISRVVRGIKTVRTVLSLKTGADGTVVEVTFSQAGPTASRVKAHSLTHWIDWSRKATVEEYGDAQE